MDHIVTEIKQAKLSLGESFHMLEEEIFSISDMCRYSTKSIVWKEFCVESEEDEMKKPFQLRRNEVSREIERLELMFKEKIEGLEKLHLIYIDDLQRKRDDALKVVKNEIALLLNKKENLFKQYRNCLAIDGRSVQESCYEYRPTEITRNVRESMEIDLMDLQICQDRIDEEINSIIEKNAGVIVALINKVTNEHNDDISKKKEEFHTRTDHLYVELQQINEAIWNIEKKFTEIINGLRDNRAEIQRKCASLTIPLFKERDIMLYNRRIIIKG